MYTVRLFVLSTGERLVTLINQATGLPTRVANRWIIRYRRNRVQPSTLKNDAHILKWVYIWASTKLFIDLDEFLLEGKILDPLQVHSLASFLRSRFGHRFSGHTYNRALYTSHNFFDWALYSYNRGGIASGTIEQLLHERQLLKLIIDTHLLPLRKSQRRAPLSDIEVQQIRSVIEPKSGDDGSLILIETVFPLKTFLRNWLMFEFALRLGLRIGEILKLRLDSFPNGTYIVKVKRIPDDEEDSRTNEPAVKTQPRDLELTRSLVLGLSTYLSGPRSIKRRAGKTPYLFVTEDGNPLSRDRAQEIIEAIGRYSGISNLTWHRLRHTWAENMADFLLDQPNGLEQLKYLGGWSKPESAMHYIQNAIRRKSNEALRRYQEALYKE